MPNRVSLVTVRVACAQLMARELDAADAALEDVIGAIAAAGALGADVVVLPECSYPGYVLLDRDPYAGRAIPSPGEALRRICDAARRARTNVAVGLANIGPGRRVRNEAVLIDRDGAIVGRYAKAHLWNFDRRWFAPGREYPVFDTDIGRIGMMICADGRVPEIARTLTRRGAWLILDPTAWVGVGSSYQAMPNPQVDFSLSVRAAENGIWIAAADKCGSETGAVHYVGRSMVVAPDGDIVASAPADTTALIVAELHRRRTRPFVAALSAAERKTLRALPKKQTASAGRVRPRGGRRAKSLAADAGPIRIGVYQTRPGTGGGQRNSALRSLSAQGAEAIVETSAGAAAIEAALRAVRDLRAALIEGPRMLAPEPARAAALSGADLLVWTRPPSGVSVIAFARTRAMENRAYVLVCTRADHRQPSCLVGPEGAVCASALTGTASGFIAAIDVRSARDKSVVWGTDAFADRTPDAYELFL
jgi:predicted amidohydrolase